MQQKFTTGAKGEVDKLISQAHKIPYRIELENWDGTRECQRIESELLFHSYAPDSTKWDKGFKTSVSNRAMIAMIRDGVWHQGLADICEITQEDVQIHHSLLRLLEEEVNEHTEEEWRDSVYSLAPSYFEQELEKMNEYLKQKNDSFAGGKGLLRALLHSVKFERENITPRMLVERRLYDDKDDLKELHEEILLLDLKLKKGEVSSKEHTEDVRKLKQSIKMTIKTRQKLFKDLFLDDEANERYTYIRAVGINRLYGAAKNHERLRVTSRRHGEDLLDMYVKWFNDKHWEEILAERKERDLKADKERYDSKPEVVAKRTEKERKKQRAIQLSQEGKSSREIASELEVGKTTILRWLKSK